MYKRRSLVLGLLAAGLLTAQAALPTIEVAGDVRRPLALSFDDLAKMTRATVRISNDGIETVYGGIWLHDVLKTAGVPVVLSLGELDLADTASGKPLSLPPGRFRLVGSKDKPAARSVRMLTKLEVVQLRK